MRRILIADDEPHVLRVLKLTLERAGYAVETVFNGEQAWSVLRNRPPHVLITDISMPQLDGATLCKKIDETLPERDFLIFVLTSRTEVEHREWSRQINHLLFLEKPVSTRKLVTMLDQYFARRNVTEVRSRG